MISFVISLLMVVAMAVLTYDTVSSYYSISSMPGASGVDYLGFLIVPLFYFIIALIGVVSSAVCMKFTTKKPIYYISCVMLIVFFTVLCFAGMFWFRIL